MSHLSAAENAALLIWFQVAPDSISFIVKTMDWDWPSAERMMPPTLKLCFSFFYPGDLWTGDPHVLEPCAIHSKRILQLSSKVLVQHAILHLRLNACLKCRQIWQLALWSEQCSRLPFYISISQLQCSFTCVIKLALSPHHTLHIACLMIVAVTQVHHYYLLILETLFHFAVEPPGVWYRSNWVKLMGEITLHSSRKGSAVCIVPPSCGPVVYAA